MREIKNYIAAVKDASKDILSEGFTWDIVTQIGNDGKSGKFIVYYDEIADMYQIKQKGHFSEGIIFTPKQYKELINAMKVYKGI